MKINNKLKIRRKELGLTLVEVADIVGVSNATISRWETGDISNMRRDRIALYAKALRVSPNFIMGIEETSNAPAPAEITSNISTVNGGQNIYSIPVFGTVSAGFGAYAESEIIDYIPVVINNPADVEDTISIKVAGDSMYPMISDNDIIIVRRQTSVDSGDIAVVLVDNTEGLVKRVVYGSTWIELQSINEQYPTQRFDGAEVTRLRVVGKVLGSYRQF